MKTSDQLSQDGSLRVIQAVQCCLYLDRNDHGTEFWNPKKQRTGTDVCQDLAGILDQHGFVPERDEDYVPA